MTPATDPRKADFATRARFVCELARRLHEYGTSAPRLEAALEASAARLDLNCDVWSNPTGILLSFSDGVANKGALATVTQVIRLAPGEVNLRRLSVADAVAEQVGAGKLDIDEGVRQLERLKSPTHPFTRVALACAHGVAAATVAVLLGAGWRETGVACVIGLMIGVMGAWVGVMARRREQFQHLAHGFEALAAVLAGFMATMVAARMPLAINSVLISSLIVLLPGMMLTTAVTELATQNLVSGMSRFAGAMAVLLKLSFGTAAGIQLAHMLGADPHAVAARALPAWATWTALAIGSCNFALMFRTAPRDYLVAVPAVWLGYVCTRYAGSLYGAEFGVFIAGLVVGAVANAYARWRNRPGALVRVPGIILLVPGSVGFRSVFFAVEGDISRGLDTAVSLLVLLISLVAGLLFANLIVAPRRTLS